MFIEITGTNFVNRGAELMLHAVLQEGRKAFPTASFVMMPLDTADYDHRARLGLHQKVWLRKYRIQWGRLGSMISQKQRRRYGLVLDEEIDVVLDASGFAYSDQWGEGRTVATASKARALKRRGGKFILLPQALGPFASPRIRRAFTTIVDNASLVFPRDEVSYGYVTDLVGKRENVCLAPDFTNLVSGTAPQESERLRGRFCLVPNYRMIDKTSGKDVDAYLSFCVTCLKNLVQLRQTPFILVHEEGQDVGLAERIAAEAGKGIDIVRAASALELKGILGLCGGVISSRYHAIISALSQGVPVLATGWSHKYEALFKEYDIPASCLTPSLEPEALKRKIEEMIEKDRRAETIRKITHAGALCKEQARGMWQKVFAAMGG
jgi:colanic acid/amylovoran biosynthesis protein